MPHPAHAGNHHTRLVGVDLAEFLRHHHRLHLGADQSRADQQQQRRHRHGQGDGQHQQVVQARFEQTLVAADLEHHKRKLTARRQYDTETNRTDLAQTASQPPHDKQQRQLDGDQQQGQAQHRDRCAEQQAEIRAHADADEKQPQQQAFERFDLRFQFVAVFGIRQQQTGEERAQCHRYADQIHQPRRADHHQQRGGGGNLRQTGAGDHTEHRSQQIPSADHHHGDAAQNAQAVVQILGRGGGVIAARQQRHHGDQRDRCDVLEQQNRECQTPMGAGQFLAFGQALQAEGRGGQCQAQPQHNRAVQRLAKHEQRHHANHRSGQQHLRQTDAKHRFAHHPQAARRQLQADDKQQQHHAEFGNMTDALRVADQPQYRRPDDHPGKQITQHRPELQALG
ncbi:hypothetical protein D3C84_543220 [compost metagenome]